MRACYFGEENLLKDFIFEYNCDLTIQNNQGKTLCDQILTFFGYEKQQAIVKQIMEFMNQKEN